MNHVFSSRGKAIAAVVAMILVGMSVRAPLTSLAAVLPDLLDHYELSPTVAGLLTSLPVLCFGVGAAVITGIARRFGLNRVVVVSITILGLLVFVRPFTNTTMLIVTTAGIGLTITAGNVLLPVVVRRDFSGHQGKVMAAVTTSMSGGAAVAAAGTIPLWLAFGWRWALALWAVLILAGAFMFYTFTGPEESSEEQETESGVWKIPGAWALAVFFGLNSGMFYASTHWLPTLLPDIAGINETQAGLAASVFQFGGLIGAMGVPIILARVYRRQLFATSVALLWVIYALGLLLFPSWYLVWIVPGAVAQGGGFAILFGLYVLRSANLSMVRDISGMTQTVGYFISALAPVTVGALFEKTGSWTAPLTLLSAMSLTFFILTPFVSSRKKLGEKAESSL